MVATEHPTAKRQKRRETPRLVPRHAFGRLMLGGCTGLFVGVALYDHPWSVRLIAGLDAAAGMLLCVIWAMILRSDQQSTKCRAAGADPGRAAAGLIVTFASSLGVFAGAYVMRNARKIEPAHAPLLIALSLGAVVVAWTLTHTSYTLRYAHLYYRDDDEGEGGLTFPGDNAPDDWDFAYFAFTLGMTFQTSDVVVTSRQIRRTVLVHSMLSFAFNTVIVALALNLLAGFLS